jgi:dTDP-4-dehydrorhamnose reductase
MSASGNILVLGATGLLGSSLVPVLRQTGQVVTHGRSRHADSTADLADKSATHALLDGIKPSLIINLAGLTNVDTCELHPNASYIANIKTVENIVAWIKHRGQSCHLLHISTDQVYDSSELHDEASVTLTNYYAFSKYAGELAAASVNSTIVRTNFFGRSHCEGRSSFTDWLYQALVNGEGIRVFRDVWFSPLALATLCRIIVQLVELKPCGIFNLGSSEGLSKAEFAFAFAESMGISAACMQAASIADAGFLQAYRPRDMRMSSKKLEAVLLIKLPSLRDEIMLASREYSRGN